MWSDQSFAVSSRLTNCLIDSTMSFRNFTPTVYHSILSIHDSTTCSPSRDTSRGEASRSSYKEVWSEGDPEGLWYTNPSNTGCWQQYRSCIIWEVALSRNHEWIMECSHLTEYSQIDDSFCHKSWNSQLFQEGSVRSSSGMYVSWQLLMLSVFSHLCGSTDFSTYYHEDKSHSSVSSCEWTFVSSTGGLPDCAVTMAGRSFGHGECTDHVTRTQIGRRWLQSGVNSSEWFPRMKWD